MIYTVFPKGCDEGCEPSHMLQDFSTMKEAESLDCDYDIESAESEVV